jgi:predicted aspartyl protease
MGKIVVKIKLTNFVEQQLEQLKLLKGKPRVVETEGLVDTGATRLYLQSRVISTLGLKKEGARSTMTS